ncbi:MAG TPA: histone deacetylase [Candidatus Krumholzibacteria bacterium]|nr:histone deacetylase [Candidatus Krumholzibacteria bacterium]HPD73165.1 histone deacetylase [Candidatus Krumholzibacteria bacterium]HRY41957.1 histone deacetylase [Candidatus Krumholzibacteria bacterium]
MRRDPPAGPLSRFLATARRRLRATWPRRPLSGSLDFVFHPDYCGHQPSGPYDLLRPYRILHYLRDQALLRRGSLHRPRPASLNRLQLIHTREYLDSLERPDALTIILGFAVSADLQDAILAGSRAMVGGTIRATKLALRNGGIAVNLGGGFHHAFADRAHGFSCFNDVAIAIRTFRNHGFAAPILVVDLDLHDGDGTRAIFAGDPTVHTFSVHNRTLLEIPAVADTCLALGPDIGDRELIAAVREHLPPVLEAVAPGLVYYLAGSDLHRRDRLGDWRLSHEGLVVRDRVVIGLVRARPAPPPCVYLLAGGYGQHAWRHPAATFSWLLTGDATIEPPLELELPLGHYRRLRDLFSRPEPGDGEPSDDSWALTEADLPGHSGAAGTLFLDAIPHHGLELVLERSGLLDRLRAKGFRKLRIESDLRDPIGHLLRVLDTSGREPRPLVELKLRRYAAAAPYSLLFVEWLLLQHAGGAFGETQPPLAGQTFPGLGLLRDLSAMLVVMCERLGLDGLAFRPAHFHMAEIARNAAVFWDPTDGARHESVRAAMPGLRLTEMDAALAAGRVVDVSTGEPYRHMPALMVVPVSRRLREGPELARDRVRPERTSAPSYRLLATLPPGGRRSAD